MTDGTRYINLRFEIQHLFPSEIGKADAAVDARRLLNSINFDLELRGNKMALLASPAMRDALRNAPESVQQAFTDAGFGWNTQKSLGNPNAHPEYNEFIIATLGALSNEADIADWDTTARERAVFDFHRYITQINFEGFPPVQGTSAQVFAEGWALFRGGKDYSDVSTYDESVIDAYKNSYDVTLIDQGTGDNTQMRREVGENLFSGLVGDLTGEELANAQKNLDAGNVTQAVSSLIHDAQLRSSTPVIGNTVAAEGWAAKLWPELSEYFDFDDLIGKIEGVFDYIASVGDVLGEKISDLGKFVFDAAGKAVNSILVGVGGGLIGDVVEFLNAVYEPFKKAISTGDWGEVWTVVGQYGVAAVFSGLLVAGSVALATALGGPIVGAFVGAGWAAYGLYDAITNGIELFGKIKNDLSAAIEKARDTINELAGDIDKSVGVIMRIVGNALDVDFSSPVFAEIGLGPSLVTKYLVDPLSESLPGRVDGSDKGEWFFGKNNAVIYAGGGDDEVYVRHVAQAFGGAGDDIVAGGVARAIKAGERIDPDDANSPLATQDMVMLLDGGEGNDWVITVGGQRAVTAGGLGRDWIYNTSDGGVIWGM